jgi:hypothetical protein
MQAEYAAGSPLSELEALEDPEPFVVLVVPTCATLAPEEPPQAAANSDNPTTPASASARSAARFSCEPPPFVVCVLRAKIPISSPSQLADLGV